MLRGGFKTGEEVVSFQNTKTKAFPSCFVGQHLSYPETDINKNNGIIKLTLLNNVLYTNIKGSFF